MSDALSGDIIDPEEKPLPATISRARTRRRFEVISVEAVEQFLDKLAQTGLLNDSADSAGISYYTVNRLRKADDTFKEMVEEAFECYRELLQREAHRRAIEGWDEPVYSQKTGTRIGTIRKYDSRLLELMLKRHCPEFREKFEGKVEITGGVLIAPVAPQNAADWAKQYENTTIQAYSPPPAPALPPADPTQQNS